MGFCHESHGEHLMSVEERGESFYIHPGYGYDKSGNLHSDELGRFGEHWRERPHPEVLLDDVPDLIRALADLPTCPPEVKKALTKGE